MKNSKCNTCPHKKTLDAPETRPIEDLLTRIEYLGHMIDECYDLVADHGSDALASVNNLQRIATETANMARSLCNESPPITEKQIIDWE